MAGTVASMGVPGLGAVTGPVGGAIAGPLGALIGSLFGSVAQGKMGDLAFGAVPDSMTSESGPVSFTGSNSIMGNLASHLGLNGLLGTNFGRGEQGLPSGFAQSITNPNTQDPTQAEMTVPMGMPSPNVGPYSGMG